MEIHSPGRATEVHVGGGGDGAGEREGDGGGEREQTTLRMSDLEEERGSEDKEATDEQPADFESRIQSLQSEVDALTARLEEEQLNQSVPLTRSRLHRHDNQSASPEMRALGRAASLMSSGLQGQASMIHGREELLNRLAAVERESCAVSKHLDQLHNSVKKMVRYISC